MEEYYMAKLIEIEKDNRIKVNPPATERPRLNRNPTIVDKVKITFPAN